MSHQETCHDYKEDKLRPVLDQLWTWATWLGSKHEVECLYKIEKILAEWDCFDEYGPDNRNTIKINYQYNKLYKGGRFR